MKEVIDMATLATPQDRAVRPTIDFESNEPLTIQDAKRLAALSATTFVAVHIVGAAPNPDAEKALCRGYAKQLRDLAQVEAAKLDGLYRCVAYGEFERRIIHHKRTAETRAEIRGMYRNLPTPEYIGQHFDRLIDAVDDDPTLTRMLAVARVNAVKVRAIDHGGHSSVLRRMSELWSNGEENAAYSHDPARLVHWRLVAEVAQHYFRIATGEIVEFKGTDKPVYRSKWMTGEVAS